MIRVRVISVGTVAAAGAAATGAFAGTAVAAGPGEPS